MSRASGNPFASIPGRPTCAIYDHLLGLCMYHKLCTKDLTLLMATKLSTFCQPFLRWYGKTCTGEGHGHGLSCLLAASLGNPVRSPKPYRTFQKQLFCRCKAADQICVRRALKLALWDQEICRHSHSSSSNQEVPT